MPVLPPTEPIVPNPNPGIISGPLFYIVVNGRIVGACSDFSDDHNFRLAVAPQIGDILYAEQAIVQYYGTLTLVRFAVYGARLTDINVVALGRDSLTLGYLTFSIYDKKTQSNLRTYYNCLPTTLRGSWRANDFVTETATFQFLNAE
ncbi:MAG: hypothetical protein ACPL5F_01360 [Moorellaceae bacterium]